MCAAIPQPRLGFQVLHQASMKDGAYVRRDPGTRPEPFLRPALPR